MFVRFSIFIFTVIQIASADEANSTCITPDQLNGDCVLLSSCEVLLNVSQKTPLEDEDELLLKESQCGNKDQDQDPLVCCPSTNITTEIEESTTPLDNEVSNIETSNNLLPVPGKECGTFYEDRMWKGSFVDFNMYPWTVLLEYTHSNGTTAFRCEGVLINKNYVLTSSNCVNGTVLLDEWILTGVRLGEWDISTEEDCADLVTSEVYCADPPVNVTIEKIIPHENYDSESREQYNDIALLRLAESVNITEFIKPICLPIAYALENISRDGITMDVVGWRINENFEMNNIKLRSDVMGMNFSECSELYEKENLQLQETQLCGNELEVKGRCHGYSGSVLSDFERDLNGHIKPYHIAIGISSFGHIPCGLKDSPNVYTSVSEYIPWILDNIVE